MEYIKKHGNEYGLDSKNIVVYGESAGANIVALNGVAYDQPLFRSNLKNLMRMSNLVQLLLYIRQLILIKLKNLQIIKTVRKEIVKRNYLVLKKYILVEL